MYAHSHDRQVVRLFAYHDLCPPSFVRTDADPVSVSATTQGRTTVYDEISDVFGIPAVFWTDVAQKATGFFGGLEFESEDDGTLGYSMAICPRGVVLCEMGEINKLRKTDRYVFPVLD